jgi:hypothetical protein
MMPVTRNSYEFFKDGVLSYNWKLWAHGNSSVDWITFATTYH